MKGLKSLVGQEYRGRKQERVEQDEAGEGGSYLPRATWAVLRMGGEEGNLILKGLWRVTEGF